MLGTFSILVNFIWLLVTELHQVRVLGSIMFLVINIMLIRDIEMFFWIGRILNIVLIDFIELMLLATQQLVYRFYKLVTLNGIQLLAGVAL